MFRHKKNNAIVWTLIFSILISVLFNPIEVRADESGNDDLSGGAGDDNYLFSKGYGTDIIEDADGTSTICFGEGISADQIVIERTNWNNVTLYICDDSNCDKNTNDRISIINFAVSEANRNVRIRFADGSEYEVQSGNSELISEKNYLLQIEEGVLIITEQPMVEKQTIQESVEEVEEETTEEEVLDE